MKKSDFDRMIKDNLTLKCGEYAFGYIPTGNKKTYELYYSNFEFDKFKRTMQKENPSAFNQFNEGKGSELEERPYKGVMVPPKMASVASSSRFAYIALSNLGVTFEKECQIKDITGIAPQLDAFDEKTNTYYEVKCHEIFDDHIITLSKQYWKCIYGENNGFGLVPNYDLNNGKSQFEISNNVFGVEKSKTMFDIKQLICHLLGISSQNGERKTLIYLFFKPKVNNIEEQEQVDNVFAELEEEIKCIFGSEPIKQFISKNNISLKAIAQSSEYMKPLGNADSMVLYVL